MKNDPAWIFDEQKSVGVNYFDRDLACTYDEQHEKFRNFKEETKKIAATLNLSKDSLVLDIGCGTGGLAINLAGMCKQVYAVDSSDAMLAVLNKKIKQQKLNNITTTRAGFISYVHPEENLDAIIVNMCLHHLPDLWKQVALIHLHTFLKPGGRLFLSDVVFSFKPDEYRKTLEDWVHEMRAMAGNQMADETIVHIREEYSTWEWIMTGMLEQAGFGIDNNFETMKNIRTYICTKK